MIYELLSNYWSNLTTLNGILTDIDFDFDCGCDDTQCCIPKKEVISHVLGMNMWWGSEIFAASGKTIHNNPTSFVSEVSRMKCKQEKLDMLDALQIGVSYRTNLNEKTELRKNKDKIIQEKVDNGSTRTLCTGSGTDNLEYMKRQCTQKSDYRSRCFHTTTTVAFLTEVDEGTCTLISEVQAKIESIDKELESMDPTRPTWQFLFETRANHYQTLQNIESIFTLNGLIRNINTTLEFDDLDDERRDHLEKQKLEYLQKAMDLVTTLPTIDAAKSVMDLRAKNMSLEEKMNFVSLYCSESAFFQLFQNS